MGILIFLEILNKSNQNRDISSLSAKTVNLPKNGFLCQKYNFIALLKIPFSPQNLGKKFLVQFINSSFLD